MKMVLRGQEKTRTKLERSPRVSVVTPSMNQAAYVGDALESVLGQTGVQTEYLVLDGGSLDGSVEVIQPFADRLAFFRSAPDGGQAPAINEGFARSTGDVLCWLNSDDMLLPGTLAFAARTLNTSEPQLVFGNCVHMVEGQARTSGSNVRSGAESSDLRYRDYVIQPAAFWTRRLWDLAGPLDESLRFAFDWDWFIRAREVATRFEAVDRYLAIYRIHEAHKSGIGGDQRALEVTEILRRYAGDEAARASAAIRAEGAGIRRWNRRLDRRVVRISRPWVMRQMFFRSFDRLTYDQLMQIADMSI